MIYPFGGGISIRNTSPTITNCAISGNAAKDGGGIGVFLGSAPIIEGNTINDNHGPLLLAGGLFVALGANPVVVKNTIQGNQGGALWVDASASILDGEHHPISLTGFDVIEDADNTVSYTGNWDLALGGNYSGGTVRMSGETGASASVPFHGRGVSLVFFAADGADMASIRIDGIEYPPVDMYRPETH